ncbi:hypothetical protein [Methylibium petroleiphilum]|uniref:hypothetical protein n=1 Tax=Methylibium petroleiphilum TaxID=105560 RepID=UPI000413739E|nr:hypothetical protein [Methylibium petroleiphilum]
MPNGKNRIVELLFINKQSTGWHQDRALLDKRWTVPPHEPLKARWTREDVTARGLIFLGGDQSRK